MIPRVDGEAAPRFALAITCIDGRIQEQVQSCLRRMWDVDEVDVVTTPSPEVAVVTAGDSHPMWESLAISVRAHGTRQIAVVAHTDCAATTVVPEDLPRQLDLAVAAVRHRHPDLEVVGLVAETGTDRLHTVPDPVGSRG